MKDERTWSLELELEEMIVNSKHKQVHNDGKKRKRDIGTSVDLSIDLNDYDRYMEFINE